MAATRPAGWRCSPTPAARRQWAAANRLVEGLSEAGIVSVLPPEDLSAIEPRLAGAVAPLAKPVGPKEGIELMVVLGGDGTILLGAERAVQVLIPLLGVNLGHVGFLAEAESSEIESTVGPDLVERSYIVEERFTIAVTLRECGSTESARTSYAINEVSIEKASRERMLEVLLEIDGRPLSRWACDGRPVATPTGSTAYAFSAGGPGSGRAWTPCWWCRSAPMPCSPARWCSARPPP